MLDIEQVSTTVQFEIKLVCRGFFLIVITVTSSQSCYKVFAVFSGQHLWQRFYKVVSILDDIL